MVPSKRRAYRKARYIKNLENAKKKLGGRCVRCGVYENLQFDHIDPATKVVEVSRAADSQVSALEGELAKCQLLCGTCHADKTLVDAGKKKARGTHGTVSSYRYCKCSKCRAAKAEANRTRKSKRLGKKVTPRQPPSHGTRSRYQHYKCRCDACRKAQTEYVKQYRAKQNQ
jgi:hypothetical protein